MRANHLAKLLLALAAASAPAVEAEATPAPAPAPAPALTDAQIVAIYDQVNGFDIETALLAQARAHTEQARSLAQHVANDHIGVRAGVLDLARGEQIGFDLPEGRGEAARGHARKMAELTALDGIAFDCAYAAHEVAFHRAAIDAVRGLLLPSARSTALRQHFEAVLPAFEHHLAETEALRNDLGSRCR